MDQYDPRPELSTEAFCAVLRNLASSGTRYVTLLGGEASIYRRDLMSILDCAAELGLLVSINTNGYASQILLQAAKNPAVSSIVVSLDAADAMTHDAIRGPGSYAKAVKTVRLLAATDRAASHSLRVEMAHVIARANAAKAADMVMLAESLGAHRLSVKHVQIVGRAADNVELLQLSGMDLLNAYCAIVVCWLMGSRLQLSMQLPAAFAYYLERRFNVPASLFSTAACAGTEHYGYVDLLGNHLPCPAMSYEDNPESGLRHAVPALNLVSEPASRIRSLPLFVNFERERARFSASKRVFPCNVCRFNDQSSPCTASLLRGQASMEVELCKAVLDYGNEAVPGIADNIFSCSNSGNPPFPPGIAPNDSD
jgi:MoaA/NifB/PqqE/SkfB family radical SAM enzyme